MDPLLVAALVRRGDEVLLVRQYGPAGPGTAWALPGGRCEPGELLDETVRREVAEETGLRPVTVLGLAYVAQLDNPRSHRRDEHEIPGRGGTATVVAFEVGAGTGGVPLPDDPDGFVSEALWVPTVRAAGLLAQHPFVFTGRPAASRVLEPASAPARLWTIRRQADGTDRVLAVSPAVPSPPGPPA